ncbi:MAG: 7-cyano-7-deazaguanine/7-aminomethyl-7-deazaguanine transporter, partial [Vibrionaceae bacterium]
PEIAMVDYAFKILISLGLFVPMYGALLNHITRRLTKTAPQPSSSF